MSNYRADAAHSLPSTDDLNRMGVVLCRAFPDRETHGFGYLLTAIDKAETKMLEVTEQCLPKLWA